MQQVDIKHSKSRGWSSSRLGLLLLVITSVASLVVCFLLSRLKVSISSSSLKNVVVTDNVSRITTTFNGCELSSGKSKESISVGCAQHDMRSNVPLSIGSQATELESENRSYPTLRPGLSRNEINHQKDEKISEQLIADIASPYDFQTRDKNSKLPSWANKVSELQNPMIHLDDQVCLVNIGNTASSTIGCALGFDDDCSGMTYVDGALSRYTTHLFHKHINDCPAQTKNYLVVVRNPLERIRSAHVSDRSTNRRSNNKSLRRRDKIYEDCNFTTLNSLAENGLAANSKGNQVCKRRANHHIRGTQQFGVHMFFNYQYYRGNLDIENSAKIYVVRAEHLTEDWSNLEVMLGGERKDVPSIEYNDPYSNNSLEGDDYLSAQSRRLLCNALCEEIQVYKAFLREAVNLNKVDVAISLAELASSCPREERAMTCREKKFRYKSPQTDSPYEIRNPDKTLPYWAKKPKELRHLAVPKDQEMCFVHVGKTAGSTMGSALGFEYEGPSTFYIDGFLTRYTPHLIHNGVNDCPSNISNYLISVRNPLERIKSAYVYERPTAPNFRKIKGQGKIYEECPFPTLKDLAERGLAKGGNATDICKDRAYKFIRGIEQFSFHAFYNYQYYYNNMQVGRTTTMYVVRTEHLLEDWNTVEWMLGGERHAVEEFERVNPSKHLRVVGDDNLSGKSRRLLCAALCDEIQMYKKLLNDAVNLNDRDVKLSYDELAESCPNEAQVSSCNGVL